LLVSFIKMMKHQLIGILLFVFCSHISGTDNGHEAYTVYIVQEAWHTGIVLTTSDVPDTIFKEISRYQSYKYLDVSWGDEKYYQFPNPGLGMGARALFWPTQSVVRLHPFSTNPQRYYQQGTIMKITMDRKAYFVLCQYIAESFERNNNGQIRPSTVYRNSRTFYLAAQKYWLFNTCNTWVMTAFNYAGFDVRTFALITAGQLFRRLEKLNGSMYIRKK